MNNNIKLLIIAVFIVITPFAQAIPSNPDTILSLKPSTYSSGVFTADYSSYNGSAIPSSNYVSTSRPYYLNITSSSGYIRINVTTAGALQFANSNARTLALWVYYVNDSTNQQVMKWGAGTPQFASYIQGSSTGQWRYDLWNTSGSNTFPGTGLYPASGKWNLLVMTSDASNNIIPYLCEPGQTLSQGSTTQPGGGAALRAPSADARLLGSDGSDPISRVGGFGFWNQTLATTQIQELCDLGVNFDLDTVNITTNYLGTVIKQNTQGTGLNVFTYQIANVTTANPYPPRADCTGAGSENCNITQSATDIARAAYVNMSGGRGWVRTEWSPQSIYLSNLSYYVGQSNYANRFMAKTTGDWAYENGFTTIVTMAYRPDALNSTGGGICTDDADGIPSNLTRYAELAVEYIVDQQFNRTFADGTPAFYIELGNEPDLAQFYCTNATTDAQRQSPAIINAYINRTNILSSAIAADPRTAHLPLVAPPISDVRGATYQTTWRNAMLDNLTNIDYWGFHYYQGAWSNTNTPEVDVNATVSEYLSACTTYGVNCNTLFVTEWGSYYAEDQNGTNGATGLTKNTARLSSVMHAFSNHVNISPQMVFYKFTDLGQNCVESSGRSMCAIGQPMVNYTLRSPYDALTNWKNLMGDQEHYTCTSDDYSGLTECTVVRIGDYFRVLLTNFKNTTINATVNVGNGFYRAQDIGNSTYYTLTSNAYTAEIESYGVTSYNLIPDNITINITSPNTPWTITEPNNQTFSFTLNNTYEQSIVASWNFNGSTQTSCNNLTSCVFIGNYTSAGNYNISFTATAATNSVNYSWSFTVNNTPVNISFQTTTPSSPVTISVGSATNFVYVLTNLDSQITNSTWVLDGVTVAGCANSTVCSWTPTSGQTGLHELNVTVTAATNTIAYTWDVTVQAAQTNQCGVTGLTGFFSYIPVVFVIFSLIGLITVIIGGSDNLVMTLSLAGLGMVLTVLVIVLGCL